MQLADGMLIRRMSIRNAAKKRNVGTERRWGTHAKRNVYQEKHMGQKLGYLGRQNWVV
jgi:hypothetical protein